VGFGANETIQSITLSEFRRMLSSNLIVPFAILKASLEAFVEMGGGRIVMFCSIVAFREDEGLSGYTATKVGLRGLINTSRREVKERNNVSIHGVYNQSIQYTGMKTILDSVLYLLSVPLGVDVDLVIDAYPPR